MWNRAMISSVFFRFQWEFTRTIYYSGLSKLSIGLRIYCDVSKNLRTHSHWFYVKRVRMLLASLRVKKDLWIRTDPLPLSQVPMDDNCSVLHEHHPQHNLATLFLLQCNLRVSTVYLYIILFFFATNVFILKLFHYA